KSYLPAIADAGRNIDLYTRSWISTKDQIEPIGEGYGAGGQGPSSAKFLVEIKYNGEQYGPPYHVAGGRMAQWASYSFQDYNTFPNPYRVLYQIRNNGTHRIFTWGSPDRVRRTVQTTTLCGAAGFSVEPMNSYYPHREYFLANPADAWFTWVF